MTPTPTPKKRNTQKKKRSPVRLISSVPSSSTVRTFEALKHHPLVDGPSAKPHYTNMELRRLASFTALTTPVWNSAPTPVPLAMLPPSAPTHSSAPADRLRMALIVSTKVDRSNSAAPAKSAPPQFLHQKDTAVSLVLQSPLLGTEQSPGQCASQSLHSDEEGGCTG